MTSTIPEFIIWNIPLYTKIPPSVHTFGRSRPEARPASARRPPTGPGYYYCYYH